MRVNTPTPFFRLHFLTRAPQYGDDDLVLFCPLSFTVSPLDAVYRVGKTNERQRYPLIPVSKIKLCAPFFVRGIVLSLNLIILQW